MGAKSQCLCITLDQQEAALGVSQGDKPVLSISEEWLLSYQNRTNPAEVRPFELLRTSMGQFKITVLVEASS